MQWDEKFRELLEYKGKYGNVSVPARWPSGLGAWLNRQRATRKCGKLSQKHKVKLEEIGLEWNVLDSNWDLMFNELIKFKAEFGHTNVPIDWPTYLGTWVRAQRRAKKSDGRGKLSPAREKRLEEISFIWGMR